MQLINNRNRYNNVVNSLLTVTTIKVKELLKHVGIIIGDLVEYVELT